MALWLGDFSETRPLAKVPHPDNEDEAEDFVARFGRHGGGQYHFTVLRKADGVFLGGIGLHREESGHEFGYWLGRPFWGQGYASEAARTITRFAFERLDVPSVWAGWFHDNPASGHVLAKLGARHNGSRMRDCAARAVKVLCHEMLLTRETFVSKKAA
jgi:RimJ/RimL family protein N-acetyltransferase